MEKLIYYRSRYEADGSTAIIAVEESTGEQYATVSVCLVDQGDKPQNENCIFIPAYNFSKAALDTFMTDLVKRVIRTIQIGFGTGLEVELKDNWKEICKDVTEA